MEEDRVNINGFESFGEYMRIKKGKIRKQNEADYLTTSNIFQGMTFYINDKTGITIQEFKQLIIENGGKVEIYIGPEVTHVITNYLPKNKYEKLKRFIIVRPKWIEDSVLEGKTIDVSSYLVQPEINYSIKQSDIRMSLIKKVEEEQTDLIDESEERNEEFSGPKSKNIDCNSPDFLDSYFSQSRLHHISTWKQELVDFADEIMSGKSTERSSKVKFLHVDLDCFFASVFTRDNPQWNGRPVAICHASSNESGRDLSNSTSEIASCNYAARKYGVRNGMFVQKAVQLCPDLGIFPYEFDKYYKVSFVFYRILSEYSIQLKALSCDEALISCLEEDAMEVAVQLKKEVWESCGINASVGISDNSLLAKLACKKAKPNGIFSLEARKAIEFISDLSFTDLPGIGPGIAGKMQNYGYNSLSQVQSLSFKEIQLILGEQNGRIVFEKVRGIDQSDPFMAKNRRTVGAEVNWAVRFTSNAQAIKFIYRLSEHVYNRMLKLGIYGDKIQLSILQKRPGSSEPRKFLGCGICDAFSKSRQLPVTIPSSKVLAAECTSLFTQINIPCHEVRGVGIHIHNLQRTPNQSKSISDFFDECNNIQNSRTLLSRYGIDESILKELPEDIQASIMEEIEANESRHVSKASNCTAIESCSSKNNNFGSTQIKLHNLEQNEVSFRGVTGSVSIVKYLRECEKSTSKENFKEVIDKLKQSLKLQFRQVGMKHVVNSLLRRLEREWPSSIQ